MFNGPFANIEEITDVSNNGERYVPLVDPYSAAMHLGHMASYRHALRYAYGKKVLDLGCGTGYGSHYLAHFGAAEVIACDFDGTALNYAAHNYIHPNLTYIQLDGNKSLPFGEQSFDFVFSSQAIEHIKDIQNFLKEIRRVLKFGGFCLITSPNKELFTPDPTHNPNEHHINEMNISEYEAAGRKIFPHVKIAGIPQNCLIIHDDKTVTVKSNEELIPSDYQMRTENVSLCENLLLFAHTKPNTPFTESLPKKDYALTRRTDPMFWDESIGRWIFMGRYPKTPPAGKIEIKRTSGYARTTLFSPFDNLYRIDVGLMGGGQHKIDVTLRTGSSHDGPVVFHTVVTIAGRKLSMLFPPFTDSGGQTYVLELKARCGIKERLLNSKTLPHFEFRNGELPVWTFHQ